MVHVHCTHSFPSTTVYLYAMHVRSTYKYECYYRSSYGRRKERYRHHQHRDSEQWWQLVYQKCKQNIVQVLVVSTRTTLTYVIAHLDCVLLPFLPSFRPYPVSSRYVVHSLEEDRVGSKSSGPAAGGPLHMEAAAPIFGLLESICRLRRYLTRMRNAE